VIYPFGEWARNPREIVTVVDKLRVIKNVIPEKALRPEEKIDLDKIEEDLENYGEYIQQNITDTPEVGIPIHWGAPCDEIVDRNNAAGDKNDMAGDLSDQRSLRPALSESRSLSEWAVSTQPKDNGGAIKWNQSHNEGGPSTRVVFQSVEDRAGEERDKEDGVIQGEEEERSSTDINSESERGEGSGSKHTSEYLPTSAHSESEGYLPSVSSSATGSQNLTEKITGTKPKSKKESGEKAKAK